MGVNNIIIRGPE